MKKYQNIFTAFLLIGQCAFLLATITHVAYYFSAFDHTLIEPYAIAVAIDGFIALFSYALIRMVNHRIKWYKIFPVFIVVALLSILSIYINGVYNRHFESMSMLSGVDNISIPIFGDVNTLIASCFSFLILAYTFVGNALASSDTHSETLEQKASRLESEKVSRDRIAEVNKGKFTSKLKGVITGTSEIATHAINTFTSSNPSKASQEGQEIPSQPEEVSQEGIQPEAFTDSLQPHIETLPDVLTVTKDEEVKIEANTEELVLTEKIPASNGHNIDLSILTKRRKR